MKKLIFIPFLLLFIFLSGCDTTEEIVIDAPPSVSVNTQKENLKSCSQLINLEEYANICGADVDKLFHLEFADGYIDDCSITERVVNDFGPYDLSHLEIRSSRYSNVLDYNVHGDKDNYLSERDLGVGHKTIIYDVGSYAKAVFMKAKSPNKYYLIDFTTIEVDGETPAACNEEEIKQIVELIYERS